MSQTPGMGMEPSQKATVSFDMGEREAAMRPLPYVHPSLFPAFLSFIALSNSQHGLDSPTPLWARIVASFSVCCATDHSDIRNVGDAEAVEDNAFGTPATISPSSPMPPHVTPQPQPGDMESSSSSNNLTAGGLEHSLAALAHGRAPPPTPPPQLLSTSMPFEWNGDDRIEDEMFGAAMRALSPQNIRQRYREPTAPLLRHRGRPTIHSCGFLGTLCETCECPQCGNTRYTMPVPQFVSAVAEKATTIMSVHLSRSIEDEDITPLIEVIRGLDRLRSISLEGNILVKSILPIAYNKHSLDTLHIARTTKKLPLPPRDDDVESGIAVLHLFDVSHPKQILRYLCPTELTTLSLYENDGSATPSVISACDEMSLLGSVVSLSLAGNTGYNSAALATLQRTFASTECCMKHLRLSNLATSFAMIVLKSMTFPDLETLDLPSGTLTNSEIKAFLPGFAERFPKLRILGLTGNDIGDAGATALDTDLPPTVKIIALGQNLDIRHPDQLSARVVLSRLSEMGRRWPLA